MGMTLYLNGNYLENGASAYTVQTVELKSRKKKTEDATLSLEGIIFAFLQTMEL